MSLTKVFTLLTIVQELQLAKPAWERETGEASIGGALLSRNLNGFYSDLPVRATGRLAQVYQITIKLLILLHI